jgi:hypothetical protein
VVRENFNSVNANNPINQPHNATVHHVSANQIIDKKPEVIEVKQEQSLLTLYDLFGFSQAERQQTRTAKRKETVHTPKSTPVQPNLFNQSRTPQRLGQEHTETKASAEESPLDDKYAGINWMDNPPINGYYEMMMGLSEERKEALQQEVKVINQRDVVLRQKKEEMLPRNFSQAIAAHHRDGSLVLDSNAQVGYLKDVTRYGATFHPLDLPTIQAEKAVLYISVRDSYQCLYAYEAEKHEENSEQRNALNTDYDEFVQRFGFLNAKANAKLILMDASGRDVLSLERAENGQFIKADIFHHPVAFSKVEFTHVDTQEETLSTSLNKYGSVKLEYMETVPLIRMQNTLCDGEIFLCSKPSEILQ